MDGSALRELSKQQFFGERLLYVLLVDPGQWPGAVERIIALGPEPVARRRLELDRDVAVGELLLQLQDELVDHASDRLRRQRRERNHRVETVAELGREHPVDRLVVIALADTAAEADCR